jgi:RNA polymerase sigma-70 factor (ECF subfamily)
MKHDAELYAEAMGGGPEEFGRIVERYQDAVFGIALSRLRNFHDAEDVAQGVFVAAFERLGDLKNPARLGAWLRMMTIHDCVDLQRRRREVNDVEHCEREEDKVAGPQREAERRELREEVLAAIGKLNKKQRETTTLFYIDGYSVAEVAAIQEVPAGTVKYRLHEARKQLKEEMMGMVEDVLKAEAPREDFGARVFEIVSRYDAETGRVRRRPKWHETVAELREIGERGMEGFVKASESPHSLTRIFAAHMLNQVMKHQKDAKRHEMAVEMQKKMLGDPNKKVRRSAISGLLETGVAAERRQSEIMPMIVDHLTDRSKRIRRYAAGMLEWCAAADVPVDRVARALVDERDTSVRWALESLLRAALEEQNASEVKV